MALGPQCQKQCKYKYDKSSADIRIGDLWGETYNDDEKGVSALIAFTEKGRKLVEILENVTLVEHPFEVVAEGQMKNNAHAAPLAGLMKMILKTYPNIWLINSILQASRVLRKLNQIIKKK